METLRKYRKFLWAAAVVLLVMHYGPCLVGPPRRAAFNARVNPRGPAGRGRPIGASRSAAAAAQQTAAEAPGATPQAGTSPAAVTPDPAFANVAGHWRGFVADRWDSCDLALELQDNAGQFAGYSTMKCPPAQFMVEQARRWRRYGPAAAPNFARQAGNPTSAILTGSVEAGSIRFHVDQNIGVAETPGACNMTGLTVTPFGTGQIAAQWQQEAPCGPGEMVLQRDRRYPLPPGGR